MLSENFNRREANSFWKILLIFTVSFAAFYVARAQQIIDPVAVSVPASFYLTSDGVNWNNASLIRTLDPKTTTIGGPAEGWVKLAESFRVATKLAPTGALLANGIDMPTILSNIGPFITSSLGFIICFGVGILLILFYFIGVPSLCCCYVKCFCCAAKPIERPGWAARIISLVFLLFSISVVITGVIFFLETSDYMTKSFAQVEAVTSLTLNDVNTTIGGIGAVIPLVFVEANTSIFNSFASFTAVGNSATGYINGLNSTINQLTGLMTNISIEVASFQTLATNLTSTITSIVATTNTLTTNLNALVAGANALTGVQVFNNSGTLIYYKLIPAIANTVTFPTVSVQRNFTPMLSTMSGALSGLASVPDLTAKAQSVQSSYSGLSGSIASMINNATSGYLTSINAQLASARDSTTGLINPILNPLFATISSNKAMIEGLYATIYTYNNYRSYGVIGITALFGVCVIVGLAGLAASPKLTRQCCGNWVLFFIIPFMLGAFLFFIITSLLGFACDNVLVNNNLNNVMNVQQVLGANTANMVNTLLTDLEGCRNNSVNLFDILSAVGIFNVSKYSVAAQINAAIGGINLSGIGGSLNIAGMMSFGGNITTQLATFNQQNIAGIDYTGYLSAANQSVFGTGLTAMQTALNSLQAQVNVAAFNDTSSPLIAADFNNRINALKNTITTINTTFGGQINNQTASVVSYVNQLPSLGTSTQRDVNAIMTLYNTLIASVNTFANNLTSTITNVTVPSVLNSISAFGVSADLQIRDAGNCVNIGNDFAALKSVVCVTLLGTFDSTFFTLGTLGAFALMTTIAFVDASQKLSKQSFAEVTATPKDVEGGLKKNDPQQTSRGKIVPEEIPTSSQNENTLPQILPAGFDQPAYTQPPTGIMAASVPVDALIAPIPAPVAVEMIPASAPEPAPAEPTLNANPVVPEVTAVVTSEVAAPAVDMTPSQPPAPATDIPVTSEAAPVESAPLAKVMAPAETAPAADAVPPANDVAVTAPAADAVPPANNVAVTETMAPVEAAPPAPPAAPAEVAPSTEAATTEASVPVETSGSAPPPEASGPVDAAASAGAVENANNGAATSEPPAPAPVFPTETVPATSDAAPPASKP